MVNGSCHSSFTLLLPKPSAALYRQTCCCCPQWQWWKRWSDLSEAIRIGLDVFSLSSCPHYSVRFQECLHCLLRGNEELVLVERSQELIFLSSLPLTPFFFSFTLRFVCLDSDLDRNSTVQLEMSWIWWQVGALKKSRAHGLCTVFIPNGKTYKIPNFKKRRSKWEIK